MNAPNPGVWIEGVVAGTTGGGWSSDLPLMVTVNMSLRTKHPTKSLKNTQKSPEFGSPNISAINELASLK